ncbi:hypothetical protein [Algoriphagus litoralis]|uniref:hypothetical protein n=1 Tax=Algoriphagus litoralis TaxID=2202829 RepID=UPI000DB97D79|nr:hypothetical protein [Algoriphagus litoralis]
MKPITQPNWSFFGLFSFRFAFIYYLIFFNPLDILAGIPGFQSLGMLLKIPVNALAYFLNDHLFFIRPRLNEMGGGSGDTSFGWAFQFTILILGIVGAIIWSVFDRKKVAYPRLHYWLCILIRYSLAGIAFSYGILKVFAMQMHFPNMSQLATPLGDYLPMRFSWMFIGYSGPYQIFSGIAEVLVALLLIWRKTALLGALLAIGVFGNVVMLNLSYDIPVKIFSMNLLAASIFLAWQERERLFAFFVQNKTALPSSLFEKTFINKREKISRILVKSAFILFSFGFAGMNYYNYYKEYHQTNLRVLDPIQPGMYHVELYVKNGDTIPESLVDSLRWRDVIFDYNGAGSVSANDSTMWMRYGRAYFNYEPDSLGKTLTWKLSTRESPIANFQMDLSEEGKLILQGKKSEDSLYVVLKKLNRHFPLAERQFHWISESNR